MASPSQGLTQEDIPIFKFHSRKSPHFYLLLMDNPCMHAAMFAAFSHCPSLSRDSRRPSVCIRPVNGTGCSDLSRSCAVQWPKQKIRRLG
ncbi:hypothetical protein ACLOJK_036024 [Asimina triloba]